MNLWNDLKYNTFKKYSGPTNAADKYIDKRSLAEIGRENEAIILRMEKSLSEAKNSKQLIVRLPKSKKPKAVENSAGSIF